MNEAQLITFMIGLAVGIIPCAFIFIRKINQLKLAKKALEVALVDSEQGIGIEFVKEGDELYTIALNNRLKNTTGYFENSEVVISFDFKTIFPEVNISNADYKKRLKEAGKFGITPKKDSEWGLKKLLNKGAVNIYSKKDKQYVNEVSYSEVTEGVINTSDENPTLPENKIRYYLPDGKLFYKSTEHEYEWLPMPMINYMPDKNGNRPKQPKWRHIAIKRKL